MDESTIRLGGMALQNGVLVHGPTSWGCAVRDGSGALHVASGSKPRLAPVARQRFPVLRGPLALAEAFALLPAVRRALPAARLPFERPAVLGSVVGTTLAARLVRRRGRSSGSEAAVAALALLPAAVALRGPDLAAYHGAEHISIGTYENGGEPAPKEHPRCGSQLVPPLAVASLLANAVASRAPRATRGAARMVGTTAAIGASLELHAWAARNPRNPLAAAIARPGLEIQRRFSTAQPSAEQLEVANAARDACLALERAAA